MDGEWRNVCHDSDGFVAEAMIALKEEVRRKCRRRGDWSTGQVVTTDLCPSFGVPASISAFSRKTDFKRKFTKMRQLTRGTTN